MNDTYDTTCEENTYGATRYKHTEDTHDTTGTDDTYGTTDVTVPIRNTRRMTTT